MQQIENADTCKGLRYDVCEDGGRGGGVHCRLLGEDVVELCEGVDNNKDVRCLELRAVPEDHPCYFSSTIFS